MVKERTSSRWVYVGVLVVLLFLSYSLVDYAVDPWQPTPESDELHEELAPQKTGVVAPSSAAGTWAQNGTRPLQPRSPEELHRSSLSPGEAKLMPDRKFFLGHPVPRAIPANSKVLRVGFMDFWPGFGQVDCHIKPLFLDMLSSAGRRSSPPFGVKEVTSDFNVLMISQWGQKHHAFPSVPKFFFTGENDRPVYGSNIFLNLGFDYRPKDEAYVRLPLWALEVSWFRERKEQSVQNFIVPLPPVSMDSCLYPPPLKDHHRFCAFVVSHCGVHERESAFVKVDSWKHVDSPGSCKRNMKPLWRDSYVKARWLRQYRFIICYENNSTVGYLTEKLIHAKASGAVPIYWGDPRAGEDFDPAGFINANEMTEDEMLAKVQFLESNPEEWRRVAQVPALDWPRVEKLRRIFDTVAKKVAEKVLGGTVEIDSDAWEYLREEPP